jgi:NADH-quinone oxidoreductase subunit L
VAAFYAAMFHLTTHAFMKSLLFLSAGNVVHMMSGVTEMGKMGGLKTIFKKTHWFFLIGAVAMSGIPPLSAFFSKDLILEQDYLAGFKVLFYVGLAASILTAYYLIRAYCLTFTGKPHLEPKILKALKEAPPIMLTPVALLALLSIVGGFIGFAFGKTSLLEGFLAEVGITVYEKEPAANFLLSPETWMSIIGAFAGLGAAAYIYTHYSPRIRPLLKNSFYVNELYWNLFAVPLKGFAQSIAGFFEPKIFDGVIQLFVRGTQKIAAWFQLLQSGQIRSYVAWMAIGTVFIIVYLVF